jgi:hypothetical protein
MSISADLDEAKVLALLTCVPFTVGYKATLAKAMESNGVPSDEITG